MSFPRSSNLATLRDFCAALCSEPALLQGRLFSRHGVTYAVTRIDRRSGLALLATDDARELSVPAAHLILAELLADAGIVALSVSVNGTRQSNATRELNR